MTGEARATEQGVRCAEEALRFCALGHDFGVRVEGDPGLADYIDGLFAPFAAAGGVPSAWYELTKDDVGYVLTFAGEQVAVTDDPAGAVGMLIWHVNRRTVERSRHLVRLHAAVASLDGHAVLLPAPMEAGKTTLVAGLVRAGFDYLSDEVGALEPDTLDVVAFPKALSIDEGSWEVLADLEPDLDDAVAAAAALPHQWQVPATAIRADAVVTRARPRFVVFPRYDADAGSQLTPLTTGDAVVRLVRCTFEFERQPDRDLRALARLATTTDCYELTVGELERACELVLGLYASAEKDR